MAAPALPATPPRLPGGTTQTRLPWWALALPLLAFGTLLTAVLAGTGPTASGAGGTVPQIVAQLRLALGIG